MYLCHCIEHGIGRKFVAFLKIFAEEFINGERIIAINFRGWQSLEIIRYACFAVRILDLENVDLHYLENKENVENHLAFNKDKHHRCSVFLLLKWFYMIVHLNGDWRGVWTNRKNFHSSHVGKGMFVFSLFCKLNMQIISCIGNDVRAFNRKLGDANFGTRHRKMSQKAPGIYRKNVKKQDQKSKRLYCCIEL